MRRLEADWARTKRLPTNHQIEIRDPMDGDGHDGTTRAECAQFPHNNCSQRGACLRSFFGRQRDRDERGPKCFCFRNHFGDACELGLGVDGWCFNGCRRRGKCVMGTCVCQPGFWCGR